MEFDEPSKRVIARSTHLKLAGIKTGLPINFNVPRRTNSIRRFILRSFVLFVTFVVKYLRADFHPEARRNTKHGI